MANNHQDYDKDSLTQEMRDKVTKEFDLESFVIFTLNNFSYRYMETKTTGEVKTTSLGNNAFAIKAIESSDEIIKNFKNPSIQKVIEIKKPDSIMLGTFCQVQLSGSKEAGAVEVNCFVNWNTPNFDMTPGSFLSKQETMKFEDYLDLRNRFASFLENVFEIFD